MDATGRRLLRRAAVALGAAAILLVALAAAPSPAVVGAPALAASPAPASPQASAIDSAVASADLRSSGQGAGPAGNPMGAVWATIVVLLLGSGTAAATVAYVRVTDRRRDTAREADR